MQKPRLSWNPGLNPDFQLNSEQKCWHSPALAIPLTAEWGAIHLNAPILCRNIASLTIYSYLVSFLLHFSLNILKIIYLNFAQILALKIGRRGPRTAYMYVCRHWATMQCHDYVPPPRPMCPQKKISGTLRLLNDVSLVRPFQGRCVPDRCVPDQSFLDIASLGQSVPWMLCPWPNHPLIGCDRC